MAAKKAARIVRPDLEPREVDANKVVDGNPPAPDLRPVEGGLTTTQRAVADFKMRNPTATIKQIAAGTGAAHSTVVETLQRPQVKMYMSHYLDEAGATLKKAAEVIAAGHEATIETPISYKGEIMDTHVQPDYKERRESAKLSMQAHGVLEPDGQQVHQHVHLTDEQLAMVATGQAKMSDFARTRPDD